MKILLIRFSSMGDVILTSPVLTYLKTAHPESSITFITDCAYVSLFSLDPRVNRVIGLKKGDPCPLREPFDKVIDLQNSKRSSRLLSDWGLKADGVFRKYHLARTLLLLFRINTYPEGLNVPQRYLLAAGSDGREIPQLKMYLQDFPPQKVLNWLKEEDYRPVLALFPFSAWKNKQWPGEYFAQTGRYFVSKGWKILVMGGKEDVEDSRKICSEIGGQSLSVAGELSLAQCGSLLTRCSLALGNDSGLSHLARACGVRTGIIYGPTTRHFGFFPFGEPPYRVFERKMLCRPCHPHGGHFCPLGHWNCMKKLIPQEVIAGLEDLRCKPICKTENANV